MSQDTLSAAVRAATLLLIRSCVICGVFTSLLLTVKREFAFRNSNLLIQEAGIRLRADRYHRSAALRRVGTHNSIVLGCFKVVAGLANTS